MIHVRKLCVDAMLLSPELQGIILVHAGPNLTLITTDKSLYRRYGIVLFRGVQVLVWSAGDQRRQEWRQGTRAELDCA